MVTKNMTIAEVLQKRPGAAEILMSFGMGCISCPSALGETIEEAAMVHGIDADEIIKTLNDDK
ncbi:DUF1858 domain-containing protein [Clostridium felsineum]|uniref:Uncharacterized protein n=1 Tax=Clostridium felsineum TaxID=36839 RepID=A0A1S8L644_9CLOT|nr:DUF1858 domain-containing protein [Clostridium felsineum]MCR3757393.1 DUF1858 domain-containing protein [Clostridium felsineum]URZ02966.1 hypothetical protein CLAUR_030000 [Clostridium felsineum]URZ08698.1 hypothetical protein CLROS_040920 [Clostridium felsineum]URZ13728.1 hypothetical protein CROST_045060 [Clostridium felsineum]URZ14319.1 hypothetical protein CLFE_003040 [Clostridium felsineum DSM 794]